MKEIFEGESEGDSFKSEGDFLIILTSFIFQAPSQKVKEQKAKKKSEGVATLHEKTNDNHLFTTYGFC